MLGALLVALVVGDASAKKLIREEYVCEDGHEVGAGMEFQCVMMHIGQTQHDPTSEEYPEPDKPSSVLADVLHTSRYSHIFNDQEVRPPNGWRSKYGVTLPMEWRVNKQARKYSGLFRSGGNAGVMRFSISKIQTEYEGLETHALVKLGAAVKLFRNRRASGNIIFASSTSVSIDRSGGEISPFSVSNFSTHIETLPIDLASAISVRQHGLLSTLSHITNFPTISGTSRFARFDRNGAEENPPVFPFEVVLVPSKAMRKAALDYKPDKDGSPSQALMKAILNVIPSEEGSRIFNVLARSSPSAEWERIGSLRTSVGGGGKAMMSKYGDERLFFSHTRFEEDLMYPCAKDWVSDDRVKMFGEVGGSMTHKATWVYLKMRQVVLWGLENFLYKFFEILHIIIYGKNDGSQMFNSERNETVKSVKDVENPHSWAGRGSREDCPFLKARMAEEAQKRGEISGEITGSNQ